MYVPELPKIFVPHCPDARCSFGSDFECNPPGVFWVPRWFLCGLPRASIRTVGVLEVSPKE